MCFVDIDSGHFESPEDLPEFPYEFELKQDLTQMLNKFKNLIGAERLLRSWPTSTTKSSGLLGQKTSIGVGGSTLRPNVPSNQGGFPNSPKRKDILQQSEAFKKMSSLAKQAGLWDSLEDTIEDIVLDDPNSLEKNNYQGDKVVYTDSDSSGMSIGDINDLKFNNGVREIFLNCFVHMFASYENFVINPSQDLESWLSNRESVHSFDKVAFLSDQPAAHLPFLSPFIETQMFTTLMDNKIISQWEEAEPNLRLFDTRIKELRYSKDNGSGEPRIITYNSCTSIDESSE